MGLQALARIIHEGAVNNPGYMTKDQSRLGRDDAWGGHAGDQSRFPRDGCGVEMQQRCLLCPWPLPARVLIQPALFANRVRE